MVRLLIALITIGLVGLGLLVCGIVGWFAWQRIGLILSILFATAVGIRFVHRMLKKVRKSQGIEDHVYEEEEAEE